MTIQEVLDAVMALEEDIEKAAPGDPELAADIARIQELEAEVRRIRSVQGPLVPDAASPPSYDERSAKQLDQALHDLMSAARSKQ
jgi:hypothetical protein